jgi:hypothetical protein
MNDARATEASTGHATKVVRDVFYPETGANQEQTIYISPSIRRVQPRSTAERQARAVQAISARRRARTRARQRSMFRSRNPLVKLALATGFSLASASVVATVLSWMLRNAPATASPDFLARGLITAYFATFVLCFIALMVRSTRKPAPGLARRRLVHHVARRQYQPIPYRRLVQEAMRRWRVIKARQTQLNV